MAKPWSNIEVKQLKELVALKTSMESIAAILHRPIAGVYLKAYREHIPLKPQHPRPMMRMMMQAKFRDITLFTANREFYRETGISQKRWPDLLYGYACPTQDEMKRVARYLNFEPRDYERFLTCKQLDLFE